MFFNKHHKIGMIGLCLLLLTSQTVLARPISYPDGYMIMQENNANSSNLMVNYSPTANYSIGYTAEYWRNEEWQFHGVQLNYLLKRWNMPKSQANFYFKSATGIAYSDKDNFDHDIRPSGFTGLTFDWEDRDYYASYDNQLVYAKDFQKSFMQKARIGITPYVGDYGDLHTWFMLEAIHNPTSYNTMTITPLVRFFKSDYLVEAGVSNYGNILFNWVVRL